MTVGPKRERSQTMKERYEELEIEVITFEAEDVIVTSIPDENEGPINGEF